MAAKRKKIWFDERLYDDVRQGMSVERVLFRERTAHQDLIVFENRTYGRILALDGIVQVTERDEYVYHEMMSHVPILAHGLARRVLIVGGGDGGILREVLRHRSVEKVTMVEIDRAVVDMCLKWMPSVAGRAFRDRRTELVIDDGARFVAETKQRYDVIIVDSTDPIGPGEVLFTEKFYRDCKRCLTPGGILVNQNGVPFLQPGEIPMTRRRRGKSFKVASFYMAAIPSYYGGLMALGWATDDARKADVPLAVLRRRFAAARLKTLYYSPDIHRGCFALPAFVAEL
ncbi:MAG TPA: polyamine aminopropyltransferase, partial [Pirellulaceae bacterium]|nr:polyamine aminopropyltransferase [Pirellulaceae bacterium]